MINGFDISSKTNRELRDQSFFQYTPRSSYPLHSKKYECTVEDLKKPKRGWQRVMQLRLKCFLLIGHPPSLPSLIIILSRLPVSHSNIIELSLPPFYFVSPCLSIQYYVSLSLPLNSLSLSCKLHIRPLDYFFRACPFSV